ncbi:MULTISPECIES: hypothetical protein, partial [unclassified Gilliamella]|uniref:hypothetical protein n=1 Tax=unclassified Gilliamella TaxID=2685620 RepID=UPI001E55C539
MIIVNYPNNQKTMQKISYNNNKIFSVIMKYQKEDNMDRGLTNLVNQLGNGLSHGLKNGLV